MFDLSYYSPLQIQFLRELKCEFEPLKLIISRFKKVSLWGGGLLAVSDTLKGSLYAHSLGLENLGKGSAFAHEPWLIIFSSRKFWPMTQSASNGVKVGFLNNVKFAR